MIVGILGKKGSGKSTVARYLVRRHKFVRMSFATPLKKMLTRGLGLPRKFTTDPTLKEGPNPLLNHKTPRYAMQTLGYEWGRQYLGEDFWVKHLANRMPKDRNIVIDDVRFDNEVQWLQTQNATFIHIFNEGGYEKTESHASEQELLVVHAKVLHNDKDKKSLYCEVEKWLATL